MRVLGIDIGLATTGWAIVENFTPHGGNKLIGFGVVLTTADTRLEERLSILFDDITDLIHEYEPTCIAVESLFYFKNQKTVINVSQARGVVLLASQKCGLEVFNYTPLQVKVAVTGYGRAEKSQMQKSVQVLYKLDNMPKPDDAADAIAVATCHLMHGR